MCGLVGIYCFDPEASIAPEAFVPMVDSLSHRGPDDGGVVVEPGVALGHRRLSIIDLDGGHQPMWDAESRIGVIFNGEIYNYRELKGELESLGHRFRTDSDTETILHAYRQWGEACVERFRGMFAFAVYDRETHDLFLARDRLGIKPLYVYRDTERLIFASELKAILLDPRVRTAVEPTAVVDYFAFNYVPGPKTILQNIRKLEPGHVLVVNRRKERLRQYWDVSFDDSAAPRFADAANALNLAIADATGIRLRSDVPLGAFLSGGIDSSLVVATMAQQMDDPVRTHTIGFSLQSYDERPYARETAEMFGTDHVEDVVDVDAMRVMEALTWHYDEPFGDSSAIPTYKLCAAARKRVTVALSGDGGDESFAGYRRYRFALAEHRIRQYLPKAFQGAVLSPLARLYPKADYLPQFLRAKSTLANLATSHERAYFLSLTQKSYPHFLDHDLMKGLRGYDPFDQFAARLDQADTDDPLSKLQYVDLKTYLPDDILVKVDRASMAHGLEVRVPLLDHHIVESAASLPASYKLHRGEAKRILRSVARERLPRGVFERAKRGFVVPLPEWFRGGLKGAVEDRFFGGSGSGFLNPRGVRRLWYEHQLGVRNHATPLWSMLMFENWYARFVGRRELSGALGPGVRPTQIDAALH